MRKIFCIVAVLVFASCTKPNGQNTINSEKSGVDRLDNSLPTDTVAVRNHLLTLTQTKLPRNYQHIDQLNQAAAYVFQNLDKYADTTTYQIFNVGASTYKNVIASFGVENKTRIVVGAHYDVYGNSQGADDNASGVVALLELARMLKGQDLNYRIDLVAYSLEEPPFFRTENMGSFVHAKSLADANVSVYGMISLEMLGYFSDDHGTQAYPEGVPPELYGDKGDFIALVMKEGAGIFEQKFCQLFKISNNVKSNLYAGPPSLPGIDFSDHMNYWHFNFSALMITDTSFYRNKNYHKDGDTISTLDIVRMAGVIDGIFSTLIAM